MAFKVQPDTIYSGDNGRLLCGEHLGMMAATFGRDIGGMAITPFPKFRIPQWKEAGLVPKCERCTKVAK